MEGAEWLRDETFLALAWRHWMFSMGWMTPSVWASCLPCPSMCLSSVWSGTTPIGE
jgi:hypothetical protein